jgi:hypothetical protein
MTGPTPFGMDCPHAEATMQFLAGIGLDVQGRPGAQGFIDKVLIVDGGLRVDPFATPSNLLHEAGHVAIVPERFRALMSGDLSHGMKLMWDEIDQLNLDPDGPLHRAALQCSESEATAWAWAAGKAIGLPDEVIILDPEYQGDGANMRFSLASNCYLGINGLSHAGFCSVRANPYRNLPVYPSLAFWLQP